MAVYIQSAQSISPQDTFMKNDVPDTFLEIAEVMFCQKINFKTYLPPLQARRISRMIKNCYACAIETLKAAELEKPEAIITASGLGCIEPTEKFLNDMLKTDEGLLAPTSFIQSTSNAVGGQLALHYKCNGYNVLYAQKSLSFESALLDAIMRIEDNEEVHILLGGFDEITSENCALKQNIGLFKKSDITNKNIPGNESKGAIPGESTSFFLLSNMSTPNSLAKINFTATSFGEKTTEESKEWIESSLKLHGVACTDIDLLLTGFNGDQSTDRYYKSITSECFDQSTIARYKHLCGEHDTATAFGTWLAAVSLKNRALPKHCIINEANRPIKNVLLYNQLNGSHHSLIMLQEV